MADDNETNGDEPGSENHGSGADEDPPKNPEKKEDTPPQASQPSSYFKKCCGFSVVAVCVLVVAISFGNIQFLRTGEVDASGDLEDKIKAHILQWRKDYPNQHTETWATFAGQLSSFASIDNVSPLVIVLAFDKAFKTSMLLASEISHAALELVGDVDNCGDMDTAKLSGGDSKIKGQYLLSKQLPHIKKCKKMIMTNLEKLNESAVKELHSMIDPDYPSIPKVVYIFTVKVPSTLGNVYGEVRQVLTSKWSAKLGDDLVNPLMSRLVNNVAVIPEPAFE